MNIRITISDNLQRIVRQTTLFVLLIYVLTMHSVMANVQQVLLVYGDEKLAEYSISILEKAKNFDTSRLHKVYYDDFSPDLYKLEADAILITLGTVPALTVAKYRLPYKTYALFITQTAHEYLLSQFGNNSKLIPFYLDQPFIRQARFVNAVLPDAKQVAVLYGPASIKLKPSIENAFASIGISTIFEVIKKQEESAAVIEQLLASRNPVVAIPDSVAFSPNNAKWLLYMAYQRNVPVIGFSSSYTRAGAVASIYSTPEQILQDFIETLTAQEKLRRDYYPRYFEIDSNESVIRSLKLHDIDKNKVMEELRKAN